MGQFQLIDASEMQDEAKRYLLSNKAPTNWNMFIHNGYIPQKQYFEIIQKYIETMDRWYELLHFEDQRWKDLDIEEFISANSQRIMKTQWKSIFEYHQFSKKFITKFYHLVEVEDIWVLVEKQPNLPLEIFDQLKTHVEWNRVAQYSSLNEEIIRKYAVMFTTLPFRSDFSKQFYLDFKDKIEWFCVPKHIYASLTEEEIEQLGNYVNWNRVIDVDQLNVSLITKYIKRVTDVGLIYKVIKNVQLPPELNEYLLKKFDGLHIGYMYEYQHDFNDHLKNFQHGTDSFFEIDPICETELTDETKPTCEPDLSCEADPLGETDPTNETKPICEPDTPCEVVLLCETESTDETEPTCEPDIPCETDRLCETEPTYETDPTKPACEPNIPCEDDTRSKIEPTYETDFTCETHGSTSIFEKHLLINLLRKHKNNVGLNQFYTPKFVEALLKYDELYKYINWYYVGFRYSDDNVLVQKQFIKHVYANKVNLIMEKEQSNQYVVITPPYEFDPDQKYTITMVSDDHQLCSLCGCYLCGGVIFTTFSIVKREKTYSLELFEDENHLGDQTNFSCDVVRQMAENYINQGTNEHVIIKIQKII